MPLIDRAAVGREGRARDGEVGADEIGLRVSILPTRVGEKVVIGEASNTKARSKSPLFSGLSAPRL